MQILNPSISTKHECVPVECVPHARWPCPIVPGGVCLLRGLCLPMGAVCTVRCLPGGVPCDLSHYAFEVTWMLSLVQLRLKSNAGVYIVLVMWPGKEYWDTPLLWTAFLTNTCENITFPQLLLRAVTSHGSTSKLVWCISKHGYLLDDTKS